MEGSSTGVKLCVRLVVDHVLVNFETLGSRTHRVIGVNYIPTSHSLQVRIGPTCELIASSDLFGYWFRMASYFANLIQRKYQSPRFKDIFRTMNLFYSLKVYKKKCEAVYSNRLVY